MNGRMDVKRLHATGKTGERGSALLIVFVFAAMVAIMLYMEMPVAAFEAQRQKEQLLIDRGNEYAHAVKLFVRKLGTYPASMDALEKTNNMRFLRHRFKDPLTGKDDWRILHAGPNGMLIDSKVKQPGLAGLGSNGTNGATQNSANSSGFGSSSNSTSSGFGSTSGTTGSAFGNSSSNGSMGSFGSGSNTDTAPPEVVIKRPRQRGPEMAANGGGQTAAAPGDQDPLAPLLPPGQADSQLPDAGTSPGSEPGQTGGPGQATAGQATAGQAAAGQAGQNATPNGNGTSSQGIGTNGTGSGFGTMGRINSGGIAGVASKAGGHSIKVVNDQTDYSLWEFYYDPTKDATKGISNALGAMGASQQANQQQNGITPFGSNNSSSPFGNNNSSNTSSPFGSNSGTPGPTSTSPTSGAISPTPMPPQTPNQ